MLQLGKKNIEITQIDPVGTYAVQPIFSDGHDTGIYSWDYFYELGVNYDELWRSYLRAGMEEAGASREPLPGAFPQRPKIEIAARGRSRRSRSAGPRKRGPAGVAAARSRSF